jgi:hypothetical protein
MNVPELFSTISRLKAFARPLHARTENRTLVRITAVLSKNTVVVRQKRRRLYKRKRVVVVQKDVVVVVFLPREIQSRRRFASHLLFLKVRPSDDGAKKEIELDVVAALRIASILLLFLRATCTVTRV